MKNTVNFAVQTVLVLVFFCSAAFADGDMSNGGKSCTRSTCPGFATPVGNQTKTGDETDTAITADKSSETGSSVFDDIKNFLKGIGVI